MADTAELTDFSQANALSAAQQRSRIDSMRTNRVGAGNSNFPRNPAARGGMPQQAQTASPKSAPNTGAATPDETAQEEEAAEGNLRYQIHLLERRGKELKKDAIKDEVAAETMAITNTWVDMAAAALIETGKATLEIVIGFLILPAGLIMKAIKFIFDRQITSLKSSSQKKDQQGDKLLAQAEKLKGRQTPLKRAAQAVTAPLKNYIGALLTEFFPLGFSPLVVFESAKEKQKSLYKLLLRAAFFCVTIGISLLILILLILLVLVLVCKASLVCGAALHVLDIFGLAPESVMKVVNTVSK